MTHMTAITLGGFDHTNALGDLVVGETVYSYNFSSNSHEDVTIGEVTSSEVTSFLRIVFDNDNHINCVPSQQFWIDSAWKNASDLEVGDVCTTDFAGTASVAAIENCNFITTMFSISSISSNDNVFAEGILVKI